MIDLVLLMAQVRLPAQAATVVEDVLRYNSSHGFVAKNPEQTRWNVHRTPPDAQHPAGWQVSLDGVQSGSCLRFLFLEDGRLVTFNLDGVSKTSIPSNRFGVKEADEQALTWLRRWKQFPPQATAVSRSRLTEAMVDVVLIPDLGGGTKMYAHYSLRFTTSGMLESAWIPNPTMGLDLLTSPKLPTARLQFAAREAYWKQGPYESAVVSYEERFIGFPYIMDEHPKLTARQKDDLAHNRGIPFYFVGIRSAEFADDPGHWIYVDARDGTIISYIVNSGRGFGPPPSKRVEIAPPGQTADVNGRSRKLFATGERTAERPEGKPCRVSSGVSLWLGRVDSKGVLWLSLGPKGWCGYRMGG